MDPLGSHEPIAVAAEPDPTLWYAPVRMDKFLALGLLTFGFYEIVWFYRNWRWVRDAEGERVWPWARAFFAPLWYFSLAGRWKLRHATLVPALYLALATTWRLPDPWWWISASSVFAVAPGVLAVNRANGRAASVEPSYGWRKRSVVVAGFGGLMWLLAGMGTLATPSAVVEGLEMRSADVAFLREAGVLDESEEVVLFYSTGFMSIRGQGVAATDRGVVSYWTDPVSEELRVAFIAYDDIASVEVNRSTSWFEDTVVRLSNAQGDSIVFPISAEAEGDVRFLEEVERRRSVPTNRTITA